MISDWELQIKSQIRRRYAQQVATPSCDLNKLKNSRYPNDLIKKLPPKVAVQYSGCGYFFKGITINGNETILDLGSGAGVDSFIASTFLTTGEIFSIDMTLEILSKYNIQNIKPICADIEYLPIRDAHVDIIIANASFNLSVNKKKAFSEAFRVLKENGRLVMRDIIKVGDLPQEVLIDPLSFNTSLGGALDEESLRLEMEDAGFVGIVISDHQPFSYAESVKIIAKKV